MNMKYILKATIFLCLMNSGWIARARSESQGPDRSQIAIDPQTGRAIGALEIVPDELRKLVEQKAKVIIIDVRDESQFRKETIKGAVHIPLEDIEKRLKEIPKDTILAFT
jgi:3-mercaptopyruvate sulfurtransferase SseA